MNPKTEDRLIVALPLATLLGMALAAIGHKTGVEAVEHIGVAVLGIGFFGMLILFLNSL